MAVNDILELGRQGLQANRQALQTTAGNIANANAPGYTRKRAVVETNILSVANGRALGAGVEVKRVMRIHDNFVQRQLVNESQSFGGYKARSENLFRIEGIVQRDGRHVADLVNKFFTDVRELSVNPETSGLRTQVQSAAVGLSDGVRSMNGTLEEAKHDLDLRINDTIQTVNTLTRELASLNENLRITHAKAEVASDLEDRRDHLLRELSTKLNFQTYTDELGQISVVTDGCVLVQGDFQSDLFALNTPKDGDKGPGSLDLYVTNHGEGRKISRGISDGELGGMIHVRDKVITPAMEQLNRIAHTVAKSVNEIHRQGTGLDGNGGRDLFVEPGESIENAAYHFSVNDEIKQNHELIAAGASGEATGDNTIALQLADLQNQKLLSTTGMGELQKHTFTESINSMIGKIGIEAQREGNFFNHQKDVVGQLENYRQSIEGVNLEEEAMNMIQYQTVFNASAKAMKVGEEMFDTILSLKR